MSWEVTFGGGRAVVEERMRVLPKLVVASLRSRALTTPFPCTPERFRINVNERLASTHQSYKMASCLYSRLAWVVQREDELHEVPIHHVIFSVPNWLILKKIRTSDAKILHVTQHNLRGSSSQLPVGPEPSRNVSTPCPRSYRTQKFPQDFNFGHHHIRRS
jgi:hypothetical protein